MCHSRHDRHDPEALSSGESGGDCDCGMYTPGTSGGPVNDPGTYNGTVGISSKTFCAIAFLFPTTSCSVLVITACTCASCMFSLFRPSTGVAETFEPIPRPSHIHLMSFPGMI